MNLLGWLTRKQRWSLTYRTGISFPDDVHALLTSDFHPAYHKHLKSRQREILAVLAALDIPVHSELAHLYLNYGPEAVRGWYELNDIESLIEWTEYAHEELEVAADLVALTSIEGQGITLFDRTSGRIFDVGYGEFELMADGKLEPIAGSVSDFISWCAAQQGPDMPGIIE